GLGAGVADGVDAHAMQGHGGERDRLLFADGEKLVELAVARMGADRFGASDEFVGYTGAGRDDDDEFVALVAGGLEALGDFLDAFDVTHGGAAVFLDDAGHESGKG